MFYDVPMARIIRRIGPDDLELMGETLTRFGAGFDELLQT
jgi:hypothetical protein